MQNNFCYYNDTLCTVVNEVLLIEMGLLGSHQGLS